MDLWSDLVLPFLFFILWSMDSLFTSSGLHGSSILSYRSFPFSFFLASLSWVSRQTWQHGLAVMAYMYSALGEDLAASHSSAVKKLSPDGLISDICYFSKQMISYCLQCFQCIHFRTFSISGRNVNSFHYKWSITIVTQSNPLLISSLHCIPYSKGLWMMEIAFSWTLKGQKPCKR